MTPQAPESDRKYVFPAKIVANKLGLCSVTKTFKETQDYRDLIAQCLAILTADYNEDQAVAAGHASELARRAPPQIAKTPQHWTPSHNQQRQQIQIRPNPPGHPPLHPGSHTLESIKRRQPLHNPLLEPLTRTPIQQQEPLEAAAGATGRSSSSSSSSSRLLPLLARTTTALATLPLAALPTLPRAGLNVHKARQKTLG